MKLLTAFLIAITAGYVHAQAIEGQGALTQKRQELAEKEQQLHALQRASLGRALRLRAVGRDVTAHGPGRGDLMTLQMIGFHIKTLQTQVDGLHAEIRALENR